MRHPSSLYRVGGTAIIAGSILMIAAVALRTPSPASLQETLEKATTAWSISFWCMAIGAFALLGGWIALYQHFHHSQVEGWTAMGLAGFTLGAGGIALLAGLNADGLPRLLDTYLRGGEYAVAAETAYISLFGTVHAIELVAWTMLWVGVAMSSLAIAEDKSYPTWLGYSGIIVSIAEIASLLLPQEGFAHDLLAMIGFVWLGIVGYIFLRIEKVLPPHLAKGEREHYDAVAA